LIIANKRFAPGGWSDVYGSLEPGMEYLSAEAEFRQRPHELLPGSFLKYLRSAPIRHTVKKV